MVTAPATEGSVKWQLCYNVRVKTWWMVSGGGRVGEPVLGLSCWILQGGHQWQGRVGPRAKDVGGYAAAPARTRGKRAGA